MNSALWIDFSIVVDWLCFCLFSNDKLINYALLAEYGTHHRLGKIGDGIRICKFKQ